MANNKLLVWWLLLRLRILPISTDKVSYVLQSTIITGSEED